MAIGRAKTRQRVQTATHRGGRGAHTELGGDLTVLAGRHHVHLGEVVGRGVELLAPVVDGLLLVRVSADVQ